jgi:hypothetical protein
VDVPPDPPQRDKTIGGGSGFKKNHPGCNCCGRVLIWDVGRQYHFVGGFDPHEHRYDFFDWNYVKEWLEDAGFAVDFVTGGSFQGPGFYIGSPDFDPYTENSAERFWTGNIFDYDLVILPFPAASTDLDTISEPCPFCDHRGERHTTPFGLPDHEYLGGLPDWWTDVASGLWRGRLVVITGTNHSFSDGSAFYVAGYGYTSSLFINAFLAADMGLEADTFGQDGADPGGGVTVESAPDLMQPIYIDDSGKIVKPDTVGATELVLDDFPLGEGTAITGGEMLVEYTGEFARQNTPEFCETSQSVPYLYDESYPVAERNTVQKPHPSGDGTFIPVDYVMVGTNAIIPTPDQTDEERDSLRAFYLNLASVPLAT